jgi:hypothetical protein
MVAYAAPDLIVQEIDALIGMITHSTVAAG